MMDWVQEDLKRIKSALLHRDRQNGAELWRSDAEWSSSPTFIVVWIGGHSTLLRNASEALDCYRDARSEN